MKRTSKNKNSVILYGHCSAAGENSRAVRNCRTICKGEWVSDESAL